MAFIDPSDLTEFDNCRITITDAGTATVSARGVPVPGAPVVVVDNVSAQEWPLTAQDAVGFTGEEITLMKMIRMDQYYAAGVLTEKMTANVDGVPHNIVLVTDEGMKSVTILKLRRVTG